MGVATPLTDDSSTALRIAELEQRLAKRDEEVARYKRAYENVLLAYERLRRQIFGKTSEKMTPEQIAFAWAAALKEVGPQAQGLAPPPPPPDGQKPKPRNVTPHGRRDLSDAEHLETETIVLAPPDLPEGSVRIGEDVTYRLEHQRARAIRLKIVRPIFKGPDAPDAFETCVVQADPPSEMIPRGLLGHGMLAHIFISKWEDCLPYNRQERILARDGIELDRSVMCRAEKTCAALAKGIVEAARKDAIETAYVIGTDATGTLVQQKGACRHGHFFVSIADSDYIFFDYAARHTQDTVKTLFGGFSGYLQADASSVYDALFRAPDGPTEIGCLAHARRKFFEAVREDRENANVAIALFEALFRVDREAAGRAPSQRLAARKARSAPVWHELCAWCEKQMTLHGRERGLLPTAVRYLLRHRVALGRFLEDGRFKLTNNDCERALRAIVVGRANWIFVGSDDNAESSAVFISLLASCRLHKLDSRQYLRDLFRLLPQWPQTRLLELHPRFWAWTRQRLDTVQLAAHYGTLTIPPAVPLPRPPKIEE